MAHTVTYRDYHYEVRGEGGVLVARRPGYSLVVSDLVALDGVSADDAMRTVKAAFMDKFLPWTS